MDVFPAHPQVVWVAENEDGANATRGRLYKTSNATTPTPVLSPQPPFYALPTVNWTTIDDNIPSPTASPTATPVVIHRDPLPNRNILKILIDPASDPANPTAYVGFAGASWNNLYRTTDGGVHWDSVTGSTHCDPSNPDPGLPCGPVNAIAINPYNSAKVYVGTDIGIYVTENINVLPAENIVWEHVKDGPSNVKISDLNFLKGSDKLLAATYGRGLWLVDLSNSRLNPKAPNDFDGDGRSDLAVVRDGGAQLVWHKDGSTVGYGSTQFGASGDQLAAADYDGDGKTDLAVFRESEQRFYSFMSSTNSLETTAIGEYNDKEVSADFDGDGVADEAVYKPATGYWVVEQSENGHLTLQWGAPGDTPVTVDFTGDGKADYGVLHEEQGMQTLSYYDGTTAHQKQFGLEGDIPVSGNYDSDNKADIAFWRPDDDGEGNGCWYITYGTNGYQGVDAIPWGQVGDVPVPGDYDGDGKMDIAVWRPGDGMWHMLQSSNGYYSELFGADGDKPVGVKAVYAARPAGAGYTKAPSWAEPRRRVERPKASDKETQQAD